ncbi:MAG: hypothetical protein C5B55_06395 [Blastocatellia bacterium]|nr:MAG: hypothetical protein C5B55_06395 [Blastocatellia bacterium]
MREYWLIDWDQQIVEIYRLQDSSLSLISKLSGNEVVTTPILPGFSCTALQIFTLPNIR